MKITNEDDGRRLREAVRALLELIDETDMTWALVRELREEPVVAEVRRLLMVGVRRLLEPAQ